MSFFNPAERPPDGWASTEQSIRRQLAGKLEAGPPIAGLPEDVAVAREKVWADDVARMKALLEELAPLVADDRAREAAFGQADPDLIRLVDAALDQDDDFDTDKETS